MLYIRQNATHKVVLGPFVDVGDGFTPETGVTLSTADEAEAILHDNGTVVDISGYTWAAITTADGYYHLTLQSGISGTVGHLTIVVQDDSVCLPVKADFTVLEEAVYDLFFASSATGNTAKVDTIASDLVLVYSDTTAIHSDTTIIASDVVQVYSDTTAIHSDTTIIASDVAQIYSDTTVIASDVVLVYSDTTAIHSDTTIIASDVAQIYSDTTVIASDIVLIYSDTAAIHSDTTIIASDVVLIYSDTTVIASDVVQIYSDTTAIHSDTTIIASDVVALPTTLFTTQMTEAYAADGTAPTMAQALFLIQQTIGDFAIAGTTITVKKLDGSTTAAQYLLDDGTSPTSRTRSS